ncbi:6-phosphofructo-2-kinase/fructose-2,6-bisphosphatase [Solidesulfovibrio sp.]|uniref:bifunctional nucleoside/nucleotide kinase/histidine phosphatase family protein n=1 Tax=Solidesulfovibrio sp. TaxID=2910990 RepID=UPI002B21B1D2|nr:6-phosphofructo-2-kinase/fructose-2,6-bisphosphatase [Solidesulfovibrio sp.]MEA4855977.1 6-phosphofructo-2-kinase/fructose-2,6-bisphosphatase [Solidesulfovibrio sp.]
MPRPRKLNIAMVGLPAMGKSTVAAKIKENLEKDDIKVGLFNNGDVRRRMIPGNTSHAGFYDPANAEAAGLRERIAAVNFAEAKAFMAGGGDIAILDATNVSRKRRDTLREQLPNHPVLFVECINDDPELLALSVARKTRLPEFAHLGEAEAKASFVTRIGYYRHIYEPPVEVRDLVRLDTLNNRILAERVSAELPYYGRIRDLLMSDWIKNLFLVRHAQSEYNVKDRVGGDSSLTDKGRGQAWALSRHFIGTPLPYIFTSTLARTLEMAEPMLETRKGQTIHHAFPEFDEIGVGACEGMSYAEIERDMPELFAARARNKYNFVYPGGEGYATMAGRVYRGIKKALYLSGNSEHIMIIGHQAVNRMILSDFLFRRAEDVPYIFIPQDKYFHIVSTQTKKLFELRKY